MRLIATVPVKNEDWILPTTLGSFQELFDVVIVADQQSTDASAQICARYPKVVRIDNNTPHFDDNGMFQLLLDAARDYEGDNIVFILAADEMLSAAALDPNVMDRVTQLEPGCSAVLEWITLWRSIHRHRRDDATRNYIQFAYRDDRKMRFPEGRLHQFRVPPIPEENRTRFEQPKVLHFAWAYWERLLVKQRWYRMLERIYSPERDVRSIEARYIEPEPPLDPVPDEWIEPWLARGIPLPDSRPEDLSWREVECLRMLRQHGAGYFAGVGIWDVDWEARRRLALARGFDGIPEEPISDPRSFSQKVEQGFMQRFHHRPPWLIAQSRLKSLRAAGS